MVPPLNDNDDLGSCITSGSGSPTPANLLSRVSAKVMTSAKANASAFPQVKFSHIQIYADNVDTLEVYKKLENDLCEFSTALELQENQIVDRKGKFQLWQSIVSQGPIEQRESEEFVPQNRDVIKQLMVGFGMRVTATHGGCGTKSFLVTTKDPSGVQIVVTAKDSSDEVPCADADGHNFHHFEKGMHQNCS
jgi:hypothetical protein